MAAQHDRYAVLRRFYALLDEGVVSDEEGFKAALTMACDLGSSLLSRDEILAQVEQLLDRIYASDRSHLRLIKDTA